MTMRVIDVAPNEAPLIVLADRLEGATSRGEPLTDEEIRSFLESKPDFLEAAKSIMSFFGRTEKHRRGKD